MTGILKKSALTLALSATALASATPAMADPYGGYRRHNGGDTAGAAILGGMVGLAIGVIAASAGRDKHRCDYNRNDDRYRDGYRNDRCYRDRNGGYYNTYPQQGGYYGNYPQQGGYYGDYRQYPQQGGYYEQRGGYYNHHDDGDDDD